MPAVEPAPAPAPALAPSPAPSPAPLKFLHRGPRSSQEGPTGTPSSCVAAIVPGRRSTGRLTATCAAARAQRSIACCRDDDSAGARSVAQRARSAAMSTTAAAPAAQYRMQRHSSKHSSGASWRVTAFPAHKRPPHRTVQQTNRGKKATGRAAEHKQPPHRTVQQTNRGKKATGRAAAQAASAQIRSTDQRERKENFHKAFTA
jgi:hypothetical protein